ncbi:MAG: DUF362 domain-containing protein [Dehalococcoidia bacterium]
MTLSISRVEANIAGVKVALIRCDTYDGDTVYEAVRQGLDLLGGVKLFAQPGEKIVLKPNVLLGSNPAACVTTHPAVFKAAGLLMQEAGASVYYGDSSSIGKCEGNCRRSGLKQVGDELGFTIADFDSGRTVSHPEALLVKSLVIANGVLDCDGLVSLPKFKTHGMMRFTGAIKNQFGCIPGFIKGQYHVKLADPYDFAAMLVDINTYIKPRLYIMDGIQAMEGNGPRNGRVRKMNVLMLSSDPVALDATACRMINLNPAVVPTSLAGEEAGLGVYYTEGIEIVGESLESLYTPEFEVNRAPPLHCSSNRLMSFIKNRICEKPVIDRTKCTICGTCVHMCPVEPKAVDWHTGDKKKLPTYKYDRCIRCFCCQETCPEGAISIRNPALSRILQKA